jgi:hypothetical protein
VDFLETPPPEPPPPVSDPPPDESPPVEDDPPPAEDDPPPVEDVPVDSPPAAGSGPKNRDASPFDPQLGVPADVAPLPGNEPIEFRTSFQFDALEPRASRSVREVLTPAAMAAVEAFVAPFDAGLLWNDLSELQDELQDQGDVPFYSAGSAAGVTSVLTVGYVLWTIRSGWLVTSLLAQMPAWRLVDPLVVLDYLDEEASNSHGAGKKEDDDSLESLLERNEPEQEPKVEDESEKEKSLP